MTKIIHEKLEMLTLLEGKLCNLRATAKGKGTTQPAMRTEAARQAAEQRVAESSAEVDALNKEVGRLKHLEQLRSSNSGLTFGQGEGSTAKKF